MLASSGSNDGMDALLSVLQKWDPNGNGELKQEQVYALVKKLRLSGWSHEKLQVFLNLLPDPLPIEEFVRWLYSNAGSIPGGGACIDNDGLQPKDRPVIGVQSGDDHVVKDSAVDGEDGKEEGHMVPVQSVSLSFTRKSVDYDYKRDIDYPMYVTSVKVFLELESFVAHESLRDRGLLTKWVPGMDNKVIFISHQWLSFEHPDPANQQFNELKVLLKNLMDGTISRVGSSPMVPPHLRQEIESEEWRKVLPSMFLWIDYHSIPQSPAPVASSTPRQRNRNAVRQEGVSDRFAEPDSDRPPEASHSKQKTEFGTPVLQECETDVGADEDRDPDCVLPCGHRTSVKGAQRASIHPDWVFNVVKATPSSPEREFRRSDSEFLRSQQACAIMSIPAYAERSSLFLVLAPVCSHVDLDQVCTYTTWRRRGWCRMELMSTIFACKDIPIMIFRGGTPQFMYPDDAVLLLPGQGQFTCCDRNHFIGDECVPCDKYALFESIRSMVLLKVAHLAEIGDMVFRRFFVCTANWYLRGLERDATTAKHLCCQSRGKEDRLAMTCQGLEEFKELLSWNRHSCDVEDDGWSLLAYAALSGHFVVMEQLLRTEGTNVNAQVGRDYPEISIHAHETPLHFAMRFADWRIAESLLDKDADPTLVTSGSHPGIDALMAACVLDRVENVRKWLDRFPDWDLERRAGAPSSCSTALLFAATYGDARNCETLKLLIAARANPMALSSNGLSPLHWAAANANASTRSVEVLVEARAEINVCAANGSSKDLPAGMAGATPLHSAVMRGNCDIIRELLELRANHEIRNADGFTAMQQAAKSYPAGIPTAIIRAMGQSDVKL